MARGYLAVALAMALSLSGAGPALAQSENVKPIGKWVRKTGKSQVVLEMEEGRLHVRLSGNGDKTLILHADYNVTRDRTLYGVVTSAECEEDESDEAEHDLVDQPFSCRFRVDEGVLVIREVKFAPFDRKENPWSGRFRAVEGQPMRTPGQAPQAPSYSSPIGRTEGGTTLGDVGASWGIPLNSLPVSASGDTGATGPLVPEPGSLMPPSLLKKTFYPAEQVKPDSTNAQVFNFWMRFTR
jgi:hypothetical protein